MPRNNARAAPAVPVRVVVFPGFLLLDAAGPVQVFATANDDAADAGLPVRYDVRLVSLHGGPVRSSSGAEMGTFRLPRGRGLAGTTLVVSGGSGVAAACEDVRLVRWLAGAASGAHRCCSVCSGALLLAAAGILRGRNAVTHWLDTDELRRRHPDVLVMDDPIYVKDGPVYTSAGITAGIDLCLALVEEDFGRTVALAVAKRLVVHHKRAGGQRQFSAALLAQSSGSELVEGLMAWLRDRLRHDIGIGDMADALGVSARTLHRRLRREGGVSPGELLARLRLEAACTLVERGGVSLGQVARRTGFGSEYNLRRAFRLRLGVTPSEYRSRFG